MFYYWTFCFEPIKFLKFYLHKISEPIKFVKIPVNYQGKFIRYNTVQIK